MKAKTYIHNDVSSDTFDFLRKALGTCATVEKVEGPTLTDDLMRSPDIILRNEYYQYKTETEAFIQGVIHTDDRSLQNLSSYIKHDSESKYYILKKVETNPARIVSIDSNKLLPNFKIPLRISINEERQRGDKFWYTVFMGGNIDGVTYPKLVNEENVFYNFNFDFQAYQPASLFERFDISDYKGNSDYRYTVSCRYPDYNKYVENYQQWEADQPELLLPNMLFETLMREPWRNIDDYTDSEYLSSKESLNFYYKAMGMWNLRNRYVFENYWNNVDNYVDLLNYYYPKNGPRGGGDERFDKFHLLFPNDVYAETMDKYYDEGSNLLNKDQYFGQNWIYNWSPDEELKNKVINAQKNIFLTDGWFDYPHPIGYPNSMLTYFRNRKQTANLNYVLVQFEKHYDAHTIYWDGGWRFGGVKNKTIETDIEDAHYQFRNTLEKNLISTKFMETLKDIEEGSITDISYTKHSFKSSTMLSYPVATEGAHTTLEDYYIDPVKLETIDYFELLTWMHNNYDKSLNDNYIALGNPNIGEHMSNIEIASTYDDNLLYRYNNSKNILNAMQSSIEHVRFFYDRLLPENLESSILPPDEGADSSVPELNDLIFEKIVDLNKNFVDVLAYKIEKTGGDATGDSRTQNLIQNFWIWNYGKGSGFAAERDIKFADSQVKYGHTYTYTAYAYLTVLGTKYKYSDFRLTKTTNVYDFDEDFDNDLYCVQFYDPTDMIIKPQILTISSAPERNPDGYQYSNLSEYNTFATSEFDILDTPQAADFYLNFEPCLKIVKVPMFQKTVTVYDNPGNKISVEPFHVINDENKIGFTVVQDNFREAKYPATITPNDAIQKKKYLETKELLPTENIDIYSESPARYLEIYKIKNEPTSYESFAKDLVAKIDLRISNTDYNRTDYTFADQIPSNVKYYYVFRFITENGMPGHLSTIYQAELIDDGGYKYALFDTYDTSKFVTNNFEKTSVSFKKLMQLEPNINQLIFDTSAADFSKTAKSQIDNVAVGKAEKSVFDGKKFKIRLTSKKTGKKTDLNVDFNIREKDFS